MKTTRLLQIAALSLTTLGLTSAPAQNLLTNPDFESGLTGWTTFGNVFSDPANFQNGARALKTYGTWGGPWSVSGAFQNFAAQPGQTWSMQAFGLNPATDGVYPTNLNFALLKIVWFDGPNGTGNMLQPLAGPGAVFGVNPGIESQQLNWATAPGQWQTLLASGIAPAGTQSVQVFGGLFLQPNFEGGSLWFDNELLTMRPVPEPASFALLGLALLAWRLRRN